MRLIENENPMRMKIQYAISQPAEFIIILNGVIVRCSVIERIALLYLTCLFVIIS